MDSLTQHATHSLALSTGSAMDLCVSRLDAALASSRKASYIPTVRDAWRRYEQNGETVALYEEVSTFLYQQYKYDEKFLNTIITFTALPEDSIYVTNTAAGGTSAGFRKYEQYIRSQALALSAELGTGIAFVGRENHLFLVRNLVDSDFTPFAVLVMEVNNDNIFRELAAQPETEWSAVTLGGVPVTLVGSPPAAPDPSGIAAGVAAQYHGGSLSAAAKAVRPDYTLCCALRLTAGALTAQRRAALAVLILAALLVLPLIGLVLWFFARRVARPVDVLVAAAGQIEQGRFGVQVDPAVMNSREMGTLGDSFNDMSRTLKNQFERIYKKELALRDARIMALQSQINPHFLNNTLEIINWEARMNGDLKACSMLESLSTMLNAAMDREHRPLVHLSEELMYVDAYLYIINERLGKRLCVTREIDETLLDAYVPRLILQPILENAVEHGITPTQQGRIALRAFRQDHWLVLEVENDGLTTAEDLARIQAGLADAPDKGEDEPCRKSVPAGESGHLGIRNVHNRLRILYGEESGISVRITKNETIIFSIKIDLRQDGQD